MILFMEKILKNETISVIIPIYNSEKYISQTIESVLGQTYKDVEVVIVDDCSTDKSNQIIENYTKKYNSIVYKRLEKNSGAAVARNKAMEIARGRYIAFLDSDDVWYPEKLEKQIELIKSNNCAICYTAIEMIDEDGRVEKSKRNIKEKIDYRFLLKNTMIATSTVLIDRRIVGRFNMPLRRSGQDYATWLMLMRNGVYAYGINEVLVKYRRRENSLSSSKMKNIFKVWNIQVENEGISKINATCNSIAYALNAFKKHYL